MSAGAPCVLVELTELSAAGRDEWRRRYDELVLPERASVAGVRWARHGTGVVEDPSTPAGAQPPDAGVFELESASVVDAPEWADCERRIAAAGVVPSAATTATLYRQISSTEASYRPPSGAAVLHAAFFEALPEHHDEFNDWYELEHVPALVAVPGYLNVRRFQGVREPEKFLALYDVADLETATGRAANEATQSPWSDRVRAKLATRRERRLFLVSKLVGETT